MYHTYIGNDIQNKASKIIDNNRIFNNVPTSYQLLSLMQTIN